MSLKKRSKNNLISLRKYKNFILKNKTISLQPNINTKVFLILSCIRLKFEKKHLNGSNVASLYFESPNELTETNLNTFLLNSFFVENVNDKKKHNLLSNIVGDLFVFYLNTSVFENNEMKNLKKYTSKEDDHEKFLLVNESIGKIMNFLKFFFPLDFNDIFRKIILLAYK